MAIDLRYWDSACFLAILKDEPRMSHCAGVIQAAEDGRVLIVTSAWTLTEVIHLGGGPPMAASEDGKITGFFGQEYFALRPVTEEIGHRARRLVWEQGYSRNDAIHVATAIDAKCTVLDTFDQGLVNCGAPNGSNLRITIPDLPHAGTLFDDTE